MNGISGAISGVSYARYDETTGTFKKINGLPDNYFDGENVVANPKGGYHILMGSISGANAKAANPQWVRDECAIGLGKYLSNEDWQDALFVYEAAAYAKEQTGLYGEDFANSEEAKRIFYERLKDNRTGRNDIGDFQLFKGFKGFSVDGYV